MSLKTAPLVQAALLALAIDSAGLLALKAYGAAGVMTAHGLGLAAGASLLLVRALIALGVRWPVAETLKVVLAGSLMAAAGRTVAAHVASAPLAIIAAGAAMGAAVGLSAMALDIAGARGLLIKAAARRGVAFSFPPGARTKSGLT